MTVGAKLRLCKTEPGKQYIHLFGLDANSWKQGNSKVYTPLSMLTTHFYFMNNRNGLYLNHDSNKPSARLGVLKAAVVKIMF